MSGTTILFLFVSILALVFLIVNFIFALHDPYQEKYSIFECGFHSFLGQNRIQFGVKFFSLALVYLLLDLEILLSFPFAVSEYLNGIYGLTIALLFIIIITIGFVFELGKSALKIDSRQVITSLNVKSSNVTELIGNFLALRPLIIGEGVLDEEPRMRMKKK
jgi:NADH-ubiquinone oxidoreductase chain 3